MYQISTLIRLIVFTTLFSFAFLPMLEAQARPAKSQSELRKAKKSKAKKIRRKRRKKRRAKKVTYKKILKWWKAGTSDARILARAKRAGYVPSKRDLRKLKKKHVSKRLITALRTGKIKSKKGRAAPNRAVDFKTMYTEDDVDFDSVPPPAGTPEFVQQNRPSAKKSIDRSLRPSAPFKGSKGDRAKRKAKRRTVVAASE